jgi:hypothetical protein
MVKTDIFTDAKSITGAIIDYASEKSTDLIKVGTKGERASKDYCWEVWLME